MRRCLVGLVALSLLATPTSGMAYSDPISQADDAEGDSPLDWQLIEISDRKATLATADFDNGLLLATRCVDGVFETTIHGLPPASGLTRQLQITLDDDPSYTDQWIIAAKNTAAFSRVPVRFARKLIKGGTLQIRVPPKDGEAATRYILDLPPSVSAVEQTLAACGKSLVDLRYETMEDEKADGLPSALEWARRPSPNFPTPSGATMSTVGFVTLSCGVNSALRPENCLIESEYPAGFNFGRSVMHAMYRSQLKLVDPSQPLKPHTTILFNINFRMN